MYPSQMTYLQNYNVSSHQLSMIKIIVRNVIMTTRYIIMLILLFLLYFIKYLKVINYYNGNRLILNYICAYLELNL